MRCIRLDLAIDVIRRGEVLVYPTEAVYGLGCDPEDLAALEAIWQLKQRPQEKGLILIASQLSQLDGWIDPAQTLDHILPSWPGPETWILPAAPARHHHPLIRDGHLAVRISAHPVVRDLCDGLDACLTSTSANLSGQPPARTLAEIEQYFHDQLPVLEGELGGQTRPSRIRHAATGETLRS